MSLSAHNQQSEISGTECHSETVLFPPRLSVMMALYSHCQNRHLRQLVNTQSSQEQFGVRPTNTILVPRVAFSRGQCQAENNHLIPSFSVTSV